VKEASVGKNMVLKRFHARARGRGARIEKPFAQVTIVVEEKREKEPAKKAAGKKRANGRGKTTAAKSASQKSTGQSRAKTKSAGQEPAKENA
jgi:large subunit ribosomal protein L22